MFVIVRSTSTKKENSTEYAVIQKDVVELVSFDQRHDAVQAYLDKHSDLYEKSGWDGENDRHWARDSEGRLFHFYLEPCTDEEKLEAS